ncbi:MAG: MaoC family dehydratase [Betaproteobacteria bacterium]
MKVSLLTSRDNYFEDFAPGEVYAHARGKTVGETENVLITNLVMNSADAHFNEHKMRRTPYGRRLSYGGVNLALVLGLAAQDTAEQALAELGLDRIRFAGPVFHGDTLQAYSEVLEKKDAPRPDAGEVRFRHWGVNQFRKIVCEGERRVLLKRRSHWGDR